MAVFDLDLEQLRQYQGVNPRPADFDAYWKKALDEVGELGVSCELEPEDFPAPGVLCYHLCFTGIGGARIHGKLLRPEKIEGRIPGVCVFHGYHHFCGSWFERLPFVYSGMAVLALDTRGQGGCSEDTSCAGDTETLYGQILRGTSCADPEKLLYRSIYSDCVQAVRILKSMPFVDEERIGLTGNSQGGGLSVACAALEPVQRIAVIYPFLSDFKRVWQMDLCNVSNAYRQFWWHFRKKDPFHEREDELWEQLGYIDIQHHAPHIGAKVLWFTGMMDQICPPSTQFAAYNKITSEKEMRILPDYGHEMDMFPFVDDLVYRFLRKL